VYIDCFKCVAVAVLCKFSGYLIAESQKTMEMVVEGKNRVAPQKYSFTTTLFAPIIWYIEGRMRSYYLFKVNKAFFDELFCFFLLLHVATTLSDPILLRLLLNMLYQILVHEICQKIFWKSPLST